MKKIRSSAKLRVGQDGSVSWTVYFCAGRLDLRRPSAASHERKSSRGKLYGRGGLESAIGSKISAVGVMSGQCWIAREHCINSICLDQGKAIGEISKPSCGFWL